MMFGPQLHSGTNRWLTGTNRWLSGAEANEEH